MLLLGLLFMLAAAAVTAGAIYDGGDDATFEVFGQTIGTTIAGVFVAGLFTMLVFFLGAWMTSASMGRARRKRVERRDARDQERESVSRMEQERAALRAENERLRQQTGSRSPQATTGSTEQRAATPGERYTAPGQTDPGATAPGATTRPERPGDTTSQTTASRPTTEQHDLRTREEAAQSGRHRDGIL
jgi:hypothetical protein